MNSNNVKCGVKNSGNFLALKNLLTILFAVTMFIFTVNMSFALPYTIYYQDFDGETLGNPVPDWNIPVGSSFTVIDYNVMSGYSANFSRDTDNTGMIDILPFGGETLNTGYVEYNFDFYFSSSGSNGEFGFYMGGVRQSDIGFNSNCVGYYSMWSNEAVTCFGKEWETNVWEHFRALCNMETLECQIEFNNNGTTELLTPRTDMEHNIEFYFFTSNVGDSMLLDNINITTDIIPYERQIDILHYENETPKEGIIATANTWYDNDYLPSKAIDGLQYPSRWESEAHGFPDWLEIDFSALGTYTINKIMFSKDSIGAIIIDYNISYWNLDTSEWNLVTPLNADWTNPVIGNTTDENYNLTYEFENVTTTKIIIYIDTTDLGIYSGMSEIYIYGGEYIEPEPTWFSVDLVGQYTRSPTIPENGSTINITGLEGSALNDALVIWFYVNASEEYGLIGSYCNIIIDGTEWTYTNIAGCDMELNSYMNFNYNSDDCDEYEFTNPIVGNHEFYFNCSDENETINSVSPIYNFNVINETPEEDLYPDCDIDELYPQDYIFEDITLSIENQYCPFMNYQLGNQARITCINSTFDNRLQNQSDYSAFTFYENSDTSKVEGCVFDSGYNGIDNFLIDSIVVNNNSNDLIIYENDLRNSYITINGERHNSLYIGNNHLNRINSQGFDFETSGSTINHEGNTFEPTDYNMYLSYAYISLDPIYGTMINTVGSATQSSVGWISNDFITFFSVDFGTYDTSITLNRLNSTYGQFVLISTPAWNNEFVYSIPVYSNNELEFYHNDVKLETINLPDCYIWSHCYNVSFMLYYPDGDVFELRLQEGVEPEPEGYEPVYSVSDFASIFGSGLGIAGSTFVGFIPMLIMLVVLGLGTGLYYVFRKFR